MRMAKTFWLICAATLVLVDLTSAQWEREKNYSRKRINSEAKPGVWDWIELPLDHFDLLSNKTFRGRYLTNDQFYKKGGPIVVYVGGEWKIQSYGVMGGMAFQVAKRNNGYLFYPEHRYYGDSLPFPKPVSTKNLRYLSPEQSIADMVYSVSRIKETVEGAKDSQVILIGGSYAGTLSIWGRLKYPHIFSMSYHCGGVIKGDLCDTGYFQTHHDSHKKINPTCLDIMVEGTQQAREMMKSEKGKLELEAMFNDMVCQESKVDRFDLPQSIFMIFSPQVWPIYKTHQICHYMVHNTTGSALNRIYQIHRTILKSGYSPCNEEVGSEWFFMVCTMLGTIQSSSDSSYGDLFPCQEGIERMCSAAFGFDRAFAERHMYRARKFYGSSKPDVTKILSIQGTRDPWLPASILDDLNDKTPVVYISDANHCLELGEEQEDETPQVVQAKFEILEQLDKWIL